MKQYLNVAVNDNALEVLCTETDTGETYVETVIDLKPFFYYPKLGLADNIFPDCLPWDDHETTDEEAKAKEAYMGTLSSHIADTIKEYLDRNGIQIVPENYEEIADEEMRKAMFLEDRFIVAVAKVLNLDENLRRKSGD